MVNFVTCEKLASLLPTTLPPSGDAGGDLAGEYPNPEVKWENAKLGTIPPKALAEGALPTGVSIEAAQVDGLAAAAAASLRTCAGEPHQANDSVPTCEEMNAAIDDAIEALPPAGGLRTCAGTAHRAGNQVPTCQEMQDAINSATENAFVRVIHDETMSGDGTQQSPLHVVFPDIPEAGLSAVAVGCGLTGTGTVENPIKLDINTQWTNCAGELLCGPQKLPTCAEMEHAIDWHAIPVESPITGNGQPDKPLGIDCEQLKTKCGIPGVDDIHEGEGISVTPGANHDLTVAFTGVAVASPITGNGLAASPLDIDCNALVNECGLLTPGKVHQGANITVTPTADGGVEIAAANGTGGPAPGSYVAGVTQVFDVSAPDGGRGVGSRANHPRIPDGVYSLSLPPGVTTNTARVQVSTLPAPPPANGFFYAKFTILNQGQPGSGVNPVPGASFVNGENVFINEATGQMYLVFARTTTLPNAEPDGTSSGGSPA